MGGGGKAPFFKTIPFMAGLESGVLRAHASAKRWERRSPERLGINDQVDDSVQRPPPISINAYNAKTW